MNELCVNQSTTVCIMLHCVSLQRNLPTSGHIGSGQNGTQNSLGLLIVAAAAPGGLPGSSVRSRPSFSIRSSPRSDSMQDRARERGPAVKCLRENRRCCML